jgi:hypothetical protein
VNKESTRKRNGRTLLEPMNILNIRSGITDVSFDDFNRKYKIQICKEINTILQVFADGYNCLQQLANICLQGSGCVFKCLQLFANSC